MTEIRPHLSVRGLTDADLPSCGWAGSSKHVRELVHQIRRAELGVEESNPRARALCERLGYRAFGREPDSWDVDAEDGSLQRYGTMCTLMCKDLT
ncbi:hypothetical protein [Kitasatospora xanthocidica]|uniref:hypothetical protein n=1 Tax=Kitasatospora xanthocidica TaxID=83382 RepID=UPI001671C9CD|nr:hypothetical protein [Kitasatospora xanthocidica]